MGVGDYDEQDFLSEIAKDVESLRIQVLKIDQISTLASNATKITELENQISALKNRVEAIAKKSEEGRTLKELVESFFTGVDSHATKISAVESQILALENLIKAAKKKPDDVTIEIKEYVDTKIINQKEIVESFLSSLTDVETKITVATEKKVKDAKVEMGNYLKTEFDKHKGEWSKEMTDSPNELTMLRIKIYGVKMEKILKQGKKHMKEAEKSSKSIPSKTSMFSLILGGVNLQTMRRNPEYFWLSIVLTITMFIGTLFIIGVSYMKLKKTQNDLLKLEEDQGPFYVEVNEFLEDVRSRNQDKSTLIYWVIQAFADLVAKKETYKKLSWSHWVSLGIFSLFSAIVPVLLLINTIINANSPPKTWGSLLFMNNITF